MTPEDWKKGMENEAASVEDAGWARETRRVSHRMSLPQLFGWVVGLSCFLLGLSAGLNAVFIGYAPALRAPVMTVSEQALNPTWLLMVVFGFTMTRRGARTAQVFAALAGTILLTSLAVRVVSLPLPPALPDMSGASIDLLPAPTGAPTIMALAGVAMHALMTGAGILLGQLGTRRRVSV